MDPRGSDLSRPGTRAEPTRRGLTSLGVLRRTRWPGGCSSGRRSSSSCCCRSSRCRRRSTCPLSHLVLGRASIAIDFVGLDNYQKPALRHRSSPFLGMLGAPLALGWAARHRQHRRCRPGGSGARCAAVARAVRAGSCRLGACFVLVGFAGCCRRRHLSEGGQPGTLGRDPDLRRRRHRGAVPVGLGLALLAASRIPGRRFFRVVFLIPMIITPVGIGYMLPHDDRHEQGPVGAALPGARPVRLRLGQRRLGGAHRGHDRRRLAVDPVHVHRAAGGDRGPGPGGRSRPPSWTAPPAAGLPPHDRARHPAGEHDAHPHPHDRGVQDRRPAQRPDKRRPGHGDPDRSRSSLLRLAHARPRRLGGDRLHAAHHRDLRLPPHTAAWSGAARSSPHERAGHAGPAQAAEPVPSPLGDGRLAARQVAAA